MHYVPAFTPLFALAVMPTLLRSQFYKMGEMEAVTRASGAEIILAKLILAGAVNLIGITVVLGNRADHFVRSGALSGLYDDHPATDQTAEEREAASMRGGDDRLLFGLGHIGN